MNANLARLLFDKETLYKEAGKETFNTEKTAVKATILPESVVETKPQTPKIEFKRIETMQEAIPTAYDYKHKVLILTNSISEAEKQLLGKIIGAIGLSFEQIDLVELTKVKGINYQSLVSQKVTTKFISFGVGFSRLGWSLLLVPYQIKTIEGVEFLLADNLQNIGSNQNLKKSLWLSLQKMFGVV